MSGMFYYGHSNKQQNQQQETVSYISIHIR
jgi:hypothetical protein